MRVHPAESDLALLAGGECSRMAGFLMRRHVRDCRECTAKVARYQMMRADLSRLAPPDLDWNRLAAEMRANIRLGIEAGECVRRPESGRAWNPRLTVAFASLLFLIVAGLAMRTPVLTHQAEPDTASIPVLESTGAGLELRDSAGSMMLLNREGAIADQTVSAEGQISARYVQGGAVTINNVSLE